MDAETWDRAQRLNAELLVYGGAALVVDALKYAGLRLVENTGQETGWTHEGMWNCLRCDVQIRAQVFDDNNGVCDNCPKLAGSSCIATFDLKEMED